MTMIKRLTQLAILLIGSFLISCDVGVGPDGIRGSSNIIISGAESTTITYDEVEFRYTVVKSLESKQSSISINVGKIGSTPTVVSLILSEADNANGFEENVAYHYQVDPEGTLFFNPAYFTADSSYSIQPAATEDNWIKFTKIESTIVQGEFEVNLENGDGAKLKLAGTFVALGNTIIL